MEFDTKTGSITDAAKVDYLGTKVSEEPILGKIRTVNEFISSDGTVFLDEKEALLYEADLVGGKNLEKIANLLKDDIIKRASVAKDEKVKKIWLEIAGRSLDFDQSPGEKLDYLVLNDWASLSEFVVKVIRSAIEQVDSGKSGK